jgi:ferrochelatase
MKYKSYENYKHGDERKIGVLLINLGTPDEPTTSSVRRYLSEFLSDPRIVEIPKIIWWLILNLIILNIRPKKSRDLYRKIWLKEGSPLLVISKNIVNKLKKPEYSFSQNSIVIDLAMRYGNPSIKKALESFKNENINRLVIIPMFPQYSAATTASIFDKISLELRSWRNIPDIRFLSSYHDNAHYINACAQKIKSSWEKKEKAKKLVFSFHGLPQVNLHKGDPYHCYCHKTARLIAKDLNIDEKDYIVTFQSRFGAQVWLQPYTDEVLEKLASDGIDSVDIFCPGFLCDCLETLEEINMQSKENFLAKGGKSFNYITALNDEKNSTDALANIISNEVLGWDNTILNLKENLEITKNLYNSHKYNKK